ncbi:MAG TPA: signal peptidase I [bacterium]|nr:signal peptidase I [bacterium]
MSRPSRPGGAKPASRKKSTFREYWESFFVALVIALVIRALVIYPFRIPTGSMESSLLIGDFLLANKFVYGIRSPDWIGIPYTQIGFHIPFFRTPGFRRPESGDVVIFKYPRDPSLNYIKRCIATSGDTVMIRDKETFVNGGAFPNAPHTQFIDSRIYPPEARERGIFPPGAGNRDNYGPVRVPAPGDTFHFTESNRDRWFEWLTIALYEGRRLRLEHRGQTLTLDQKNINRWEQFCQTYPLEAFRMDGEPLRDRVYTVKNRHYFLMGDNRDNSLDSRYWGFLPERLVVGEGLIVYWSWDGGVPLYRLFEKVRWKRFLMLIH